MMSVVCKLCQSASEVYLDGLFDDRYGYPGTFTVYRCTRCGFGQTVPELSGQALADLYTNYYPRKNITAAGVQASASYHAGSWARWRSWWQGTNNTCHWGVQAGSRVLDIGCGSGVSLLEIQAQGAEAFGTEEDRNVEPIARELNLKIHFGDVLSAGYSDQSFDTITMSQLLEHISDPIQFLKNVRTKLKSTGRVVMSFPNIDGFNQRRNRRTWINWHMPFHVNFFTRPSIERLAEQAGFTVQRVQTITPNVWLQLQLQANSHPATEGQPNPIWLSGVQTQQETVWQRRWRVGKALLFSQLRVPLTRWQDARGQGDSWLVMLTPKQ
jgi:2-polyprenyl-3-methyl-5-hydroxy-6-metoxy-1,4-benzoquinol methylase